MGEALIARRGGVNWNNLRIVDNAIWETTNSYFHIDLSTWDWEDSATLFDIAIHVHRQNNATDVFVKHYFSLASDGVTTVTYTAVDDCNDFVCSPNIVIRGGTRLEITPSFAGNYTVTKIVCCGYKFHFK
jgi:hypothetical protein